ncbi:hypothetical protein [Actinotalea caeni]|uniref:hypothetical protein n=1 Tax=Actinotalea caeni TaxID=1348467 RepID=UPI0012E31E25|nr:hypothetical protein [Actinotalea caeni]
MTIGERSDVGEKYSVHHASASKAANETSTAVGELTKVGTTVTDAIGDAEAALPAEFQTALQRLKTFRELHVEDIATVSTFAAGAVASLQECLKTYEHASADMVAESWALENKVVFEHGSILPMAEGAINDKLGKTTEGVNGSLPSREEGRSDSSSYSTTRERGGPGESTSTTRSSTRGGSTTATTRGYDFGYDNATGRYSSETTHSVKHTSNGVTDTTTYYNGTSFRPGGGDESHASGRSYAVSTNGQDVYSTQTGSMSVRGAR